MKKFAQLLLTLIPAAIFIVLQLAVSMILTFGYILKYIAKNGFDVDKYSEYVLSLTTDSDYLWTVTVVFEILALITFVLLYFVGLKKKMNTFSNRFSATTFPAIILLFMGAEFGTGVLLQLSSIAFPKVIEDYAKMIEQSGLGELSLISTMMTLIAAPIVEELAFRGVTMHWAKKFSNKFWVVNLIQAFLFGFVHLNIVQGTYAFLLGLFLGYVANKYNSLWPSILGHLAFNFTGTYLVGLAFGQGPDISFGRLAIVMLVSVVFVGVAFKLLSNDKDYSETAETV